MAPGMCCRVKCLAAALHIALYTKLGLVRVHLLPGRPHGLSMVASRFQATIGDLATLRTRSPLLRLSCLRRSQRFLLKHTDVEGVDRTALRSDILSYIESRSAAPMYDHFCQSLGWARDAALAERMASANRAKLEELEAKLKDAEENLGDVEVREALLAKADYLASIGDLDAALAAYDATGAWRDAVAEFLRASSAQARPEHRARPEAPRRGQDDRDGSEAGPRLQLPAPGHLFRGLAPGEGPPGQEPEDLRDGG